MYLTIHYSTITCATALTQACNDSPDSIPHFAAEVCASSSSVILQCGNYLLLPYKTMHCMKSKSQFRVEFTAVN